MHSSSTLRYRLRSAALRSGLLMLLVVSGCDRGSHPDRLGRPAPLFTVSDGTQTVDLAKLRGRVVVLNLWASTCAPCIEELPSLLDLQHRMPEIAVVGVSIDEDDQAYRRFLARHHVDLVTVRDADQPRQRTLRDSTDSRDIRYRPGRCAAPQVRQRTAVDQPRDHAVSRAPGRQLSRTAYDSCSRIAKPLL